MQCSTGFECLAKTNFKLISPTQPWFEIEIPLVTMVNGISFIGKLLHRIVSDGPRPFHRFSSVVSFSLYAPYEQDEGGWKILILEAGCYQTW